MYIYKLLWIGFESLPDLETGF